MSNGADMIRWNETDTHPHGSDHSLAANAHWSCYLSQREGQGFWHTSGIVLYSAFCQQWIAIAWFAVIGRDSVPWLAREAA